MSEQNKYAHIWPAALTTAIILIAVVIWAALNRQPLERANSKDILHEHTSSESLSTDAEDANTAGKSINDIIRTARGWQPAHKSWYGKTAPDFTITDITGKTHTLSDYRGRNVMVTFWASWCMPCLMEIPHLNALRSIISEDKLAILAISNEYPDLVKKFAADQKISYTVFSLDLRLLPKPYSYVNSIPAGFFIDQKGRLKLATEGFIQLASIRAILQAE